MKRQFLFRVLPLMFAALISTQCDKDEVQLTKEELLTGGYWKKTSVLSDGVEIIQDCQKDNIYVFTSDGKYYSHVGANNCGGTELSGSATWSFSADETVLNIGSSTPQVQQLDENTLKLNFAGFGVVETYTH